MIKIFAKLYFSCQIEKVTSLSPFNQLGERKLHDCLRIIDFSKFHGFLHQAIIDIERR